MTNRPRPYLVLLAALAALAAAPRPSRAADPDSRCQQAVVKAMGQCVKRLGKAEVACFKQTGGACVADAQKLLQVEAEVEKETQGRCFSESEVAAAGYAPLTPAELSEHFHAACTREVGDIAERAFGGADGSLLAGASDADARCLLAAGKEASELLAKAVQAAGKCAGRSCDAADLDRIEAKLEKLEAGAAKALDKKCANLAGLVGLDPAAFAQEARDRLRDVTASPCDPLDPDYCLFPFPNDYFARGDVTSPTGRRLALSQPALPANDVGAHVDPASWNVVDGFSVGPALLFLDGQLDLGASGATPLTDLATALDPGAPVLLLDAESGERQLLFVERDLRAATPEAAAAIVRVGANFANGRRYIVVLRNLRDAGGAPLPADPVFAAYRDRTPTRQLPVEARRAEMEALFASLEGFGIAREELYLAWDFTTQSVESTSRKLLAMRDDALEDVLGGGAPTFTVDQVDEPFNQLFRRVDGTFQVPLYLTQGGAPGSMLRLGADGLPVNQGDFFTARYRCLIPMSATTAGGPPAVPARAALYGHGLLGTKNETSSSHVRVFADEYNFVICGTDWTGFAEEDRAVALLLLRDFSGFARFVERQHQGLLNFMALGRLLLRPEGFASHPAFQVGGESVIDPSGLFYDGNSQGGILGGVLAAFSPDIERFVLGVPGINYSTLLDRSVDFDDPFRVVLNGTYPDRLDQLTLFSVAQILWDQTDPSGHVRHTTADPYPDTLAKKILYQVAFGDHQVAPFTVEVAARSNGASIHTPILVDGKVVPEVTPYYGIPAIPAYPFDGSAVTIWDSGNPAPPTGNLPPPEILPTDPEWADLSPCAQNWDSDPHECPRRAPEARLQKSEFLKNGGAVVDACMGMPCLAPTFF
jgi:hypothetical protein